MFIIWQAPQRIFYMVRDSMGNKIILLNKTFVGMNFKD
jgi:hypothetical protein